MKMSQAFYPTKDGHIGNLAKLSILELTDLIDRQASLLKKKNFIQKLPDKGKRNIELLERLNQELASRNSQTPKEELSQVKEGEILAGELDIPFEKMKVSDSNNTTEVKPKHFFEIAEERYHQNEKEMRRVKRLNQYINAYHVQDCPDDIKVMQPPRSNIREKAVIPEESSAVPPVYKYNQAQVIPLDESLHLQKAQKETLDKIQAVSAAQRLSQSLGLKMASYSPEGVDMSYRGATCEIESDSDDSKQGDIYDEGDDDVD